MGFYSYLFLLEKRNYSHLSIKRELFWTSLLHIDCNLFLALKRSLIKRLFKWKCFQLWGYFAARFCCSLIPEAMALQMKCWGICHHNHEVWVFSTWFVSYTAKFALFWNTHSSPCPPLKKLKGPTLKLRPDFRTNLRLSQEFDTYLARTLQQSHAYLVRFLQDRRLSWKILAYPTATALNWNSSTHVKLWNFTSFNRFLLKPHFSTLFIQHIKKLCLLL